MNYGTFIFILIAAPALSLFLYACRKILVIPAKYIAAPFFAMTMFFAFCYVDLIMQWRLFDRVSSFLPM